MAAIDIPTARKSAYSPIPCGDSLTIPFRFNWDAITDYQLDFNNAIQQGKIDSIQSMWIDNVDNAAAVIIEVQGTDQRIIVDAGGIASMPVISREIPRINVASTTGADQRTRILMNNFPLPMHTYTPTP